MRKFTPQEKAEQKRQINELYAGSYGKKQQPGEPAKYDISKAGPQGNMFDVQAQQPKGAIKSSVPLSEQIRGTMFAPTDPIEPSLFDCNASQEDER